MSQDGVRPISRLNMPSCADQTGIGVIAGVEDDDVVAAPGHVDMVGEPGLDELSVMHASAQVWATA
jgi:hypothetical protein